MKKLTTDDFIKRAISIWGYIFDYSKVIYINSNSKVKIRCIKHDFLFEQAAYSHLAGHGCIKCSGKEQSNTLDFIQKSIIIFGELYDYSLIEYVNCFNKVKIICKIHHFIFEKSPINHLKGQGCPKCSKRQKLTYDTFVEKANIVHHNKYDYSNVIYLNNKTKIKIRCPQHNSIFQQSPNTHLRGHGCPRCGRTGKYNTFDFITKSSIVHDNKYDYSRSIYTIGLGKIIIICSEHGNFSQTANHHLLGSGCPKCVSSISYKEQKWINMLNISNIKTQFSIKLNDGRIFKVDAYDPTTNTVYEFYGDYWHGNPIKYVPTNINDKNHQTFGFLYEKTLEKEKLLKEAKYNIVSIWESDFDKIVRRTNV